MEYLSLLKVGSKFRSSKVSYRMPTQLIIFPWQQVKGIPFLAFDAGGVLEMFDQTANEDAVILEPGISALYTKIKGESCSIIAQIDSLTSSFFAVLNCDTRVSYMCVLASCNH